MKLKIRGLRELSVTVLLTLTTIVPLPPELGTLEGRNPGRAGRR